MTLGSLFDGIGGFPLAAARAGIEPVWASEIEAAPVSITKRHFPRMAHYGDITKINGAEIEPVDIITFGSPCFPAGTMVLTATGYIPIEEIKIGDFVLTHKNRWRKATAVGSKIAPTYRLKGNIAIETTAEHPIYSADVKNLFPRMGNGKRGNIKTLSNIGQWTEAKNMQGKQWATPLDAEDIQVPMGEKANVNQNPMPKMDSNFWYFVGRWLGDGWVRDDQRCGRPQGEMNGQIFLADSFDKEAELINTIGKIAKNYNVQRDRTVVKVRFISQVLCKWLVVNFGKGAINKTIPAWVLSLLPEYRQQLLLGLIDSDGYRLKPHTVKITSISKKLILGVRLIAESLGYSTSVSHVKPPKTKVIEGRIVNQNNYYTVALCNSQKRNTGIGAEGHKWYKCRSVESTGEIKQVFNLSVDEDESYIADSIVVHNCQDLSVAGKRAGLDGERSGLFMEAVRIIKEMRDATNGIKPRFCVWENVPGAFSSNGGEDFRTVIEEIAGIAEAGISIPRPSDGWLSAGAVMGNGYSLAWRTLDAQYWGVPQRRRRIFLVADFGGGSAGEILFKPDCPQGYFEAGGEAGEGTAGEAEKSADGRGKTMRDTAGTLRANAGAPKHESGWESLVLAKAEQYTVDFGRVGDRIQMNAEKAVTLQGLAGGGAGKTGLYCLPIRAEPPIAFACNQRDEVRDMREKTGALQAQPGMKQQTFIAYCIQGNTIERSDNAGANGKGVNEELCFTLSATDRHAVAYDCRNHAVNGDVSGTLQAKENGGYSLNYINPVHDGYSVRRLTPTECERLQGFHDGWTAYGHDGKAISDNARYRALGNSVCIPICEFIMARLRAFGEEKSGIDIWGK